MMQKEFEELAKIDDMPLIVDEAVQETLKNLKMEFVAKHENKGIIFEIYRIENGCLECYTYPRNKEWEKRFFAASKGPIDFRDMLLCCESQYF